MAQESIKQLFHAIEEGNAESLKALFASYTYSKDQLNSALIQTVKMWSSDDHSECLDALLAEGGFVRTRDRDGRSLLMLAAAKGQASLVEDLAARGCDVLEQDLGYRSALHIAIDSNFGKVTETVRTLLKLGANWKQKDNGGNTALHYAAKHGKVECLVAILDAGCRADVHNHSGDSPLHLAVRYGHDRCIEELLRRGANPTLLNKTKVSPIDEAQGPRLSLLSRYVGKKEGRGQKWVRSRTAPLELPSEQEPVLSEALETKIAEERTAKDRALSRAKTLSAELENVKNQVEDLKNALEAASRVTTFPCLFLTDEERPSLNTLFAQLSTDLMAFYVEVETWQRRTDPLLREVASMIRADVKTIWEHGDIEVYGSVAAQLHLPKSDLNLMILHCPDGALHSLASVLSTRGYATDMGIFAASLPVLKVTITAGGWQFPVSLTQFSDLHTGRACVALTKTLVQSTPLLRQMVLVLKHLVQWCDVNQRFLAEINSYALLLLATCSLQSRKTNIDLSETLFMLMNFCASETTYDAVICVKTNTYPYVVLEPQPETVTIQDPLNPSNNVGEKVNLQLLLVCTKQTVLRTALSHLKRMRTCSCPSSRRVLLHMLQETKFSLN